MTRKTEQEQRYPRRVDLDGKTYVIEPMRAEDGPAVGAFIAALPAHDLLFLSKDVTNPKVLSAWMEALGTGRIHSLVVRDGETIVGCTALVTETLTWSRHVGEMRVLTSPAVRGQGLGRELVQECFRAALELGLEKLCVRMTVDQQAAIASFEGIGFRAEALLRKHVRDHEGKDHDLAVLSHDVAEVQSRMSAYGVTEAFDGA